MPVHSVWLFMATRSWVPGRGLFQDPVLAKSSLRPRAGVGIDELLPFPHLAKFGLQYLYPVLLQLVCSGANTKMFKLEHFRQGSVCYLHNYPKQSSQGVALITDARREVTNMNRNRIGISIFPAVNQRAKLAGPERNEAEQCGRAARPAGRPSIAAGRAIAEIVFNLTST